MIQLPRKIEQGDIRYKYLVRESQETYDTSTWSERARRYMIQVPGQIEQGDI